MFKEDGYVMISENTTLAFGKQYFVHDGFIYSQELKKFVGQLLKQPFDIRKQYYPLLAKDQTLVLFSDRDFTKHFCVILEDLATHPELIGSDPAPYQQLILGIAPAIKNMEIRLAQNFFCNIGAFYSVRINPNKPGAILNAWDLDKPRYWCKDWFNSEKLTECNFKIAKLIGKRGEEVAKVFVTGKAVQKVVFSVWHTMPDVLCQLISEYADTPNIIFLKLMFDPIIRQEHQNRKTMAQLSASLKKLRTTLNGQEVRDEGEEGNAVLVPQEIDWDSIDYDAI